MTVETGFAQVPNEVLRDSRLSAPSRLLYSILKSYAWQDDNSFPGQMRLAEEMGCSDRMVRSYLQELEDCGLVAVEQRGKMVTNRYYLTDKISSEWKPISTSDRKPTSTHIESDRKQVSAMSGSTVPVMTGSPLPTKNTHVTNTQIKNTTTPLPPETKPAERPLAVDDEKAKALKVLRTLIARPNEQFINGGTNKFMHDLADNHPGEWVNAACELAAGKNASLTYVKAILDHWQRHGFKCECRNPKSIEPIPIQKRQQNQQPYMSEYGVPYADITHALNYPKEGTYGKDFIFRAKEA